MQELQEVDRDESPRHGIGGSDIAAILGVSEFRKPINVYQQLLGEAEPFAGNEFTQWGETLEPIIAHKYSRRHDAPLITTRTVYSHWRRATPDFVVDTEDVMHQRGLEVKNVGIRQAHKWGEEGTDQVPREYLCQVQWYMHPSLCNLEYFDFAILVGGNQYREYRVKQDLALIERMEKKAKFFWEEYVQKKCPPPPDSSKAYGKYLADKYPHTSGEWLPAQPVEETLANLQAWKVDERKAADHVEQCINELKLYIGKENGIDCEKGRVSWKQSKDVFKMDWQAAFHALAADVGLKGISVNDDRYAKEHGKWTPGKRPFLTPRKWIKP